MEATPIQGKVNAEVKADATSLVQATAEVISSINKGVTKIGNALFGKWIARNERSIELIQAQTKKDCADISSGAKIYRDGELLDYPVPKTVVDVYDALHTLNHMADARRLQAAVEEAVRQISNVPPEEIADDPISQTFFNRWRREAEMIDEDDLRQFWARLLVEETKKPNSISPGTLEVARNLTRADALLFQKLCRGTVNQALIVDRKGRPINGAYMDLLTLQDAGLLNSHNSTITTESQSEHAALFFNLLHLAICSEKNTLRYACYTLTRAGREIMNTISVRRTQDDVIAMARFMAEHDSRSRLFVFRTKTVRLANGKIQHEAMLDSPVWSSVG